MCTESKQNAFNEIMKWEETYSSGSGTWHKMDISFWTMKGTPIFIHCPMKISTGAEKLQPKLHEVIGRAKTKIFQGTVLEMHPCGVTDHQIGRDWGWKSNKTTEVFWGGNCFSSQFRAYVQMYGQWPQYTAETDVCAQKCLVAAASTIWARRSSESTGDMEIRALVWPHTKRSTGMRSGNLGGQAICLPHPIQWHCKRRSDVLGPWHAKSATVLSTWNHVSPDWQQDILQHFW